MNKFSQHVDLIEDSFRRCLSIDHKNRREYFFKNNKGLLSRKYDNMWENNSIELSSTAEAGKYISSKRKLKLDIEPETEKPFMPGKIIRDNEYIFNTLQNLNLPGWEVIFRANRTRRIIIKKEHKKRESDFIYYSILVKLRLKGRRNFIEIGEGSVREPKFNLSGLSARINEIVENHRTRKNIEFRDRVPVVLSPGDGGILLHEILGHSLEADYLHRKISPLSLADMGKTIISENVTLSTGDGNDDFFKQVTCDDEGEDTKPLVLVKNGMLRNVLADSFYKELLNLKHCGHARVDDFTGAPMPRMYALYLQPGDYHPQELIASTKYGVYAREFGEGRVYFDKNLFYFNIKDAVLIENGRFSFPLGEVVVRGNIIEALNSIAMVADDFRYDKGISYCFKNGQTINVRVGQPSIKILNLFVTKEIDD